MHFKPETAKETPLPAGAAEPAPPAREILLIGHPNVGKSVVFSLLTGRYANVSNYPGTTVEITRGWTEAGGTRCRVIDTPGVHSLLPLSQDERVTRDLLLDCRDPLVVQVVDAKNLDWNLQLTLQLLDMRVPMVLCLNMTDEAEDRGIRIDAAGLEARLGIPVVRMVAVRRHGLKALKTALRRATLGSCFPVRYPPRVEEALGKAVDLLPGGTRARRALSLMILAGDDTLREWLQDRVSATGLDRLDNLSRELRRHCTEPVACLLDRTRLSRAEGIGQEVRSGEKRHSGRWLRWVEPWTIHPIFGFPILLGILYLLYLFVGVFGAGTCVDAIERGLFGRWVNPFAIRVIGDFVPFEFLRDFLIGPYGLFTMAITYAVAIVLPIVGTFFIAFGILEDSGYLPRLAAMLNRAFRAMGLNGKAVLPMVLGLGCDTMATLTTRVLETWKERATVIILLAVGIPCSAQLAVIFAMLGALSGKALLIWLGVVVAVVFLVGALAARVLPGKGSDFVLEIPPLRIPRLGNIVVKTFGRLEWYLREAVPLFLLGTATLFLLDRLGWLAHLQSWASPVVVHLLGLPPQATEAFLIGFLRRDFGAAGLFFLQGQGKLDPVQTLVSVVTLTLFIPCIANFFMIVKEKSLRFAFMLMVFATVLALLVGTGMNFSLRALEVSLG